METGSTQSFSVPLTNTVVGKTTHIAYKYWNDASVEPKTLRPELVFTLYRYIKSEAEKLPASTLPPNPTYFELDGLAPTTKKDIYFEKVTDHNDPVVTTNDALTLGPSGKRYDWKIAINDLPLFDTQGREYAYVLREQMGNDGWTVRGTYKGETARTVISSGTNAGEYDEFFNTIHSSFTLSGNKTWKGHESYKIESTDDLPEPTITLYRTTDPEFATLTDLNGKDDRFIANHINNTLFPVDSITMTGAKNRYQFPSEAKKAEWQSSNNVPQYMVVENGELMLPKYDENGQRYNYGQRGANQRLHHRHCHGSGCPDGFFRRRCCRSGPYRCRNGHL